MTTILSESRAGVLHVTLNRPHRLNALDQELIGALGNALALAASDRDVKVVLLRGEGRSFCAGGDINAHAEALGAAPAEKRRRVLGAMDELSRVLLAIITLPKPVIAVAHGPVAGAGVGLMAAADIVLAADDATFTLAQASLGLPPDGAASFVLPRVVGLRRALTWSLTGMRVSAQDALASGLVSQLHAGSELLPAAEAAATALARGVPRAQAHAKRLMWQSLDRGAFEQIGAEATAVADCFDDPEFLARVAAYLDARKGSAS
jgi:2-(1,2-epoxy-1,2-dihydrophenyl)acetyl-CoA isomerase